MNEVKMENEIINGIVGILKSLVSMDTYFIYQISFLQKYLIITIVLLFILTLYTVYFICQNSNRIKKLENKLIKLKV
jgi:hypothetical protein